MRFLRYLLLTLAALFVVSPLAAQDVVSWTYKVDQQKEGLYRVTFEGTIEDGWHIYDLGPYQGGPIATNVQFEKSAALELSGKLTAKPVPARHRDEAFKMDIGYFERKAVIYQDVKLKGDKATLKGVVEWQSCNDTSCLPPMEWEFSIEIKSVAALAVAGAAGDSALSAEEVITDASTQTVVEQPDETVQSTDISKDKKSLWALVLEAIAWGFVALLTPCVFPMVPVTVSFFMKGGENKMMARFRAAMFGIFIVALYTLPIALIIFGTKIFGGDGSVVGMFNWLATHWLPNIIFFLVFMIFAASFFGAFEITLPSWMVNKSDSKSDKGGLLGVFFMALTLVLVSFSCTGAIVGSVLVQAATGSTVWWEPIVVMFAFAVVFAIPFVVLAFIPSLMTKVKSGGWLNSVKVSLGFIEVALAFKFLMTADQAYGWGLLPRELYLAIWIVTFALLGFYLLGKIKFKHDSDVKYIGVTRLTLVMITFTFVAWMVPGMWGAQLKALSGYMPPLSSQSFVLGAEGSAQGTVEGRHSTFINPLTGKAPKFSDMGLHTPEGFNEMFFDLQEASEYAAHVNKPVFVDITGIACVNCREMEQNVWTDPTVAKLLKEEFVMVAIFLDVKKDLPESAWTVDKNGKTLKQMGKINTEWSLRTHNQIAQPLYVIQDSEGTVLVPVQAYNRDVNNYIRFLESGLAAFRARQQ